MGRKLPRFLIRIILKWYESDMVVVRWKSSVSQIVQLTHGVRQGDLLSPYFFAIDVDENVDWFEWFWRWISVQASSCGLIYADDIILISASVLEAHRLIDFCLVCLNLIDIEG